MEVSENTEGYQPKAVALGTLKPTNIFYFAYVGFPSALKENGLYMTTQGGKDKRTAAINVHDGEQIMMDNNHQVVRVNAKLVYLLGE